MENEILDLKRLDSIEPIKDIEEIIRLLNSGETLRVEQKDSTFILRLKQTSKYKGTEVSYDIKQETFYYTRYWQLENVSLNLLMNTDIYLDKDNPIQTNTFSVGEAIKYYPKGNELNEEDLGKITGVYIDKDNNYYYTITNDKSYYKEVELSKYN